MSSLRLRDLNPLRLLQNNFSYQSLPNSESRNVSPSGSYRKKWTPDKLRFGRFSLTKMLALAIGTFVTLALMAGGGYRHRVEVTQAPGEQPEQQHEEGGNNDTPPPFYWQIFPRLDGYYNGIRTLVPKSNVTIENRYNTTMPPQYEKPRDLPKEPPIEPIKYDPYPDYESNEYLSKHLPKIECFLDDDDTIPVPDVYAYPGIPEVYPEPFYGSYEALGMRDDVCFDRYGRLGAYGYGDVKSQRNNGLGMKSEKSGSEKVFEKVGHTDYTNVDWAKAQKKCYEKNKARFSENQPAGKERVKRHAYVLRTWTGFKYTDHHIMTLRAQINELALKSGGEYDVHFLVHVKDDSIPIWADENVYQQIIDENVPLEFRGLATLWSEKQMEMYYPDPFPSNFINMAGSSIHGVYRSAHFAIQWFSQQFKEYDFVWNWEMDLRYTGHYYEFNNRIGEWSKAQPRKGLWERNERFYIPAIHGSYENFTKFVGEEMERIDIPLNDEIQHGPHPVWGPVQSFPNNGLLPAPANTTPPHSYKRDNYEWGVGEDADILTFNPLFDPSKTNWVFREDVTGYDNTLPVPPRRVAIITVARLSRRLLDTMHEETWRMRHSMFPEMWPPSVALHHGLKAAYVPHPVYFDRDWDLNYMNQIFNYPKTKEDSTFGWGEHNMLGASFYYNAGFSGALWRRWLGKDENGEGGRKEEENGTGRMCLRPVLHHPIKGE